MIRFGFRLCAALCMFSSLALFSAAQEESKKDPAAADKPAAAKDATYKVKRERLKIEVDLSGVFEANQMSPISLRPESWSAFTVVEAVPHGSKVQKGESLVRLDMSKIDEQLQDLETTMQTNKLTLQLAESELGLFKTTLPMDLESAARANRIAEEDLNYFLKINRSFQEESAEQSLKSSRQSLENAEEELKQLEKMYNADDLTEETEEIVLKRARNDVERSQFYLKSSELRTKKTLTQDLPREEQQLTEAAGRAEVALAKTKATLPVQFEKQQLERQKQLLTNKRTEEKLNELRKDREMMEVKSPADGYVYYGRWTRGKWSGAESVSSQLEPGGKLAPRTSS